MNVPLYQFTAIDIRIRLRFLAYGEQQNLANDWTFIVLVVLWIRAFGVKGRMIIQTDWGSTDGKNISWMRSYISLRGLKSRTLIPCF